MIELLSCHNFRSINYWIDGDCHLKIRSIHLFQQCCCRGCAIKRNVICNENREFEDVLFCNRCNRTVSPFLCRDLQCPYVSCQRCELGIVILHGDGDLLVANLKFGNAGFFIIREIFIRCGFFLFPFLFRSTKFVFQTHDNIYLLMLFPQ